jgi:glutamine synthetase
MSDSQRNSLGIKSLPSSLKESLIALKSDLNYLKVCFQMELVETYIGLKEEEIREIGNDKSKTKQFMLYYDI